MEFLLLIILLLTIFFFGNYLIHLYFKNKRILFLKSIENKKNIFFIDIYTNLESSSSIGYRDQYNYSDILFFDEEIFVLFKNSLFNGKIIQYQPIIHFSKNFDSENFDGVSKKIIYSNKIIQNGNLKLSGNDSEFLTNIKFKLFLNFKEKNIDITNL